ncbi:MAG: hypothetical protein IKW62_01330 [Clostridia bacterium]|nr:hypothetical protein [Clostridia bacterium]
MKKRLFSIIAAILITFQSVSAFAADYKMIFNDIRYYNATIYVCDTQNNAAILLNVVPTNGSYNINLTRDIEYRAIGLNINNIYGSKGQKLTMNVINGYLLDSPVKVLVGKNGYGYRILCMEFLR